MSSPRFLILCLTSAFAAFVGGFVSNRLASPLSVVAQGQPEIVQLVRTQQLQLVDKAGKVRGSGHSFY
jgi:hypothetical protein